MTETCLRSLPGKSLNIQYGKCTIHCDTAPDKTIKPDETLQVTPLSAIFQERIDSSTVISFYLHYGGFS